MPQPAPCDDRGHQLVPRERRAVERLADGVSKYVPQLRRHTEIALPARPLPHSARGHQREERSALLGCDEMQGAPHRPGLDEPALGQGAADLAVARRLAPDTDGELGGRRHLRLHTAETADHTGDGRPTDRVQQLAVHAPRERLPPGDLRGHVPSVRRPTIKALSEALDGALPLPAIVLSAAQHELAVFCAA